MPKLRKTDQQLREAALWAAIAERAVRLNLKTDAEIAARVGMNAATYSRRKQDPFARISLAEAVRLNRALGISPAQCLEYMGYPAEVCEHERTQGP